MTTATRLGRLCGWSIRCASVAISVAFCASAFAADPSKNVVAAPKQQPTKKNVQKACFTFISGSAIAQPCDRLMGPIPTTASQLSIYGRNPAESGR